MIRSRTALSPHHLGSRASVIVFAVVSTPWTMNGPAVCRGLSIQPLLKTFGSLLVDAGYSGLNSACQSAYGFLKVTTACLALLPCATEATWSYPVVEETLYALLVPLRAFHCAMRSSAVIGLPSDQVALG